jgi:hypothetical protein
MSVLLFQGKAQWVKYAVMDHFVSLVMAVISIIALALFYRQAAVFFAGLIVIGMTGALKLRGTAIH